jgi:hypothetical protein
VLAPAEAETMMEIMRSSLRSDLAAFTTIAVLVTLAT